MSKSINEILDYKKSEKTPEFNNTKFFSEKMKDYANVPGEKIQINVPPELAKTVLENCFQHFLSKENKKLIWRPEYDEIVSWIMDNEGRGLFLFGECGLGKSMLSRYVIPAILYAYFNKYSMICSAQEMNSRLDEVLELKIISLDDIGTESLLNEFGNKRLAFAEVMDSVERKAKLAIISTNLNAHEIEQRYGTRTLDRIVATTKRIEFKGDSFRK